MSQSPLLPSPLLFEEQGSPTPDDAPEFVKLATQSKPSTRVGAIVRGIWRMATVNPKVAVGSCIVLFFLLVALFGPVVVSQNPLHYTADSMAPPGPGHILGTNQIGQDVWVQLVVGTRSSVFWSLLTGFLVLLISVSVGLIAGYFGGIIDDILSLVTNVFLVIPAFPLAILAVEFFSRTTLTIALIVALTNWPWGARVLRAQTLSLRNREYVSAARASGEHTWRIIFREIFPNELSIVAASFITTTIQVLLAVAGLEFLGFGDSSAVSWGTMLYDASNSSALLSGAWWWFAPPGLCIALFGCGLALLNFGIDEIADPRLRQSRRRLGLTGRWGRLHHTLNLWGPKRRQSLSEGMQDA
jgi:peptide/nickel transport system permease protein